MSSIKKLSETFRSIHRNTPVLDSLYNKVGGLHPATFSKRDSSAGAFLRI